MAGAVLVLFGLLFRDPPVDDGAESTEAAPIENDPGGSKEPSEEGENGNDGTLPQDAATEAEASDEETDDTGKAEAEGGEEEPSPIMPIEGE